MSELPTLSTIPTGPRADDSQEPFKSQPLYSRPGRRAGLTVWGDGTVDYREGSPDGARHAAPVADASLDAVGPLQFFREGTDSSIMSRQAQLHDIVDLGGRVGRTTVGAAIHNGWLIEAPGGGFERAGEAAATSEQPSDSVDQQGAPQAPQFLEPLRAEDEQAYTTYAEKVGDTLFSAIEVALSDADLTEIPPRLITEVALRLGTDEAGARQAIGEAAAPLYAQASARVDSLVGNSELVFQWARNDPAGRKLLSAAMRDQVDRRDLGGYRDLAVGYLSHLAKTDQAALVAGLKAGGTEAVIKGGKVLVDLGGGDLVELESALRGNVIQVGGRR
jgi:hypothetical protein